MWRYRAILPVRPGVNVVSMGEGWTPLVSARGFEPGRVYLKNEAVNPTGSHKDRALSIGITKALEFGKGPVILYSDGSTALSSAAYAARGGLTNIALVPGGTPRYRSIPLAVYGCVLLEYHGPSAEALDWVHAACRKLGVCETSNYRQANPYESEGAKTIGYEIFEQMSGVPSWVVVPTGGGGTLAGIWRAFEELHAWGFIAELPHMAAVLPAGYTMLEQALTRGLATDAELRALAPAALPETIQAKTAMGYPPDGLEAMAAIRKSGGMILYASDQEVLTAQRKLGGREGIYAEPSGAAAWVGVEKLVELGRAKSDSIVAVITGSGFRETGTVEELVDVPTVPIFPGTGLATLGKLLSELRTTNT